ncbi:MAG: hypothetical protein QHH26_03160 [Armatimonadota bacterium]|nr:hypothetical protein [Armatimonadota bacterium]
MNRGIIIFLASVAVLGAVGLFLLKQGSTFFLKSPDEVRIAYVSDVGGNIDIWTMKPDGSDKRQVTNDQANDRLPVWSPNGKEIASVSDRRENVYQVFVSAWDGSYTKQLTVGTGTKDFVQWSADGSTLAYISSGRVFTLQRHGGTEQQILPPVTTGVILDNPPYSLALWSPRDKKLAVIMNAEEGQRALVLENFDEKPFGITAARRLAIAWSPSGEMLAVTFIGRGQENGILTADISRVLTKDLWKIKGNAEGPLSPAWSPDGKLIAFEMWTLRDGYPDKCKGIYTINASGGKPKLIVSGDAREPTWSPDGKYLAYVLFRPDGGRDIWRINADGSNPLNLTNGKGDNYQASWSPLPKK